MNNRQDMRNRVDELLEELAAIEQQQENDNSHSDQQLLDQAWEDLSNQIALLQEAIEMGEEMDDEYEREDEEEEEADWGGEEHPISTTIQKVYFADIIPREELERLNKIEWTEDDRVAADHYETDYGVYYNAADEV